MKMIALAALLALSPIPVPSPGAPVLSRLPPGGNALRYSDDLTQVWTVYRGTAPNASTIQDNATTGTHYAYQPYTATSEPWTLSVELKAGTKTLAAITPVDNAGHVWFDLASGVILTVSAGSTARIEARGDGWYRCSVTRTLSAGATTMLIAPAIADGATIYTGDGTGTIQARHAQLWRWTRTQPYCATTTAAKGWGCQ